MGTRKCNGAKPVLWEMKGLKRSQRLFAESNGNTIGAGEMGRDNQEALETEASRRENLAGVYGKCAN